MHHFAFYDTFIVVLEGLLKRETDKDVYNFTIKDDEIYLVSSTKSQWERGGCILNFYAEFFVGSYLLGYTIDTGNQVRWQCKQVTKNPNSSSSSPKFAYQIVNGEVLFYVQFPQNKGTSIYVSKVGNAIVPKKNKIDFNALTSIPIEA